MKSEETTRDNKRLIPNEISPNEISGKEISMAIFGILIAATASLLLQFLVSSASDWIPIPTLIRNFLEYSFGAAVIAGTVVALYSSIRLCQKIIHEKNKLSKAIIATLLSGLFAAFVQAIGEYFWTIAPSFNNLEGNSLAFSAITNLAWQVSGITGISLLVFMAYAAYCTGRAIFWKS